MIFRPRLWRSWLQLHKILGTNAAVRNIEENESLALRRAWLRSGWEWWWSMLKGATLEKITHGM